MRNVVKTAARAMACAMTLASATLPSTPARAFDYPEHRQMALDGVAWARGHLSGVASETLVAMIDALHAQLRRDGDGLVCAGDAFAGARDNPCFDLGDIPALAGDHSSSSVTLVTRYFHGAPSVDGTYALRQYVVGAAHAKRVQEPPGPFDGKIVPNRAQVLRITRDASLDSDQLLDALLEADGVMLRLAAHNATHFWLYRSLPRDAASSTLTNAFAAYAVTHWRATVGLRRALALPPGHPDRPSLLANSLLHELYGYHFLEDALAAGHIASNRLELTAASSYATHNQHNVSGVAVHTTDALRRRADEVRTTTGFGAERDDTILTYGDGVLLPYVWDRPPPSECPTDALRKRRVLAMGGALVAFSLEELVGSAVACSAEPDAARCFPLPPDGSAEPTPTQIRAALASGWGMALDQVPTPAEWPRVLYNVDMGAVFRLSAGLGGEIFAGGGKAVFAQTATLSPAMTFYVPDSPRLSDLGMWVLGFEGDAHLSTPDGPRARPTTLGLRLLFGHSGAANVFEIGPGVGAATAGGYGTLTDATTRPAGTISFRYGRRFDTRNDYALSLFYIRPEASFHAFAGELRASVGVGIGIALERWRTPPPVCSAASVPGRPSWLVDADHIDCFHTRDPSYGGGHDRYSNYVLDLAR